jgi:hypothetical protein
MFKFSYSIPSISEAIKEIYTNSAWSKKIGLLSLSHGHNMIMVADKRLSKYAHFVNLSNPYTVVKVAKLSWTTYSNCMACLPP